MTSLAPRIGFRMVFGIEIRGAPGEKLNSSESSTTIGDQKRHNMYMRFPTLDDFLYAMGYGRR